MDNPTNLTNAHRLEAIKLRLKEFVMAMTITGGVDADEQARQETKLAQDLEPLLKDNISLLTLYIEIAQEFILEAERNFRAEPILPRLETHDNEDYFSVEYYKASWMLNRLTQNAPLLLQLLFKNEGSTGCWTKLFPKSTPQSKINDLNERLKLSLAKTLERETRCLRVYAENPEELQLRMFRLCNFTICSFYTHNTHPYNLLWQAYLNSINFLMAMELHNDARLMLEAALADEFPSLKVWLSENPNGGLQEQLISVQRELERYLIPKKDCPSPHRQP